DQLVDSFTEVSLLVSAGSPEPSFIMPALKGQPLEQAYKILRPEGITIERITNEVHDELASETILSQTPAAGSRIQAKDKLSLAISVKSTDASRKSRLATIQFDVPEGNPRRVQIDVLD